MVLIVRVMLAIQHRLHFYSTFVMIQKMSVRTQKIMIEQVVKIQYVNIQLFILLDVWRADCIAFTIS